MIQLSRKFTVYFFILFSICCSKAEDNPTEFVTRIYDQYQTNHIPDLLGADGDTIFTPSFLDKYRAFSKKSSERHGLGWDPLCECDDKEFPGYSVTDVKIKMTVSKPNYAEFDVRFKNSGFGAGVILVLMKTSGNWLIDDIQTVDMPSLRKYIVENQKRSKK